MMSILINWGFERINFVKMYLLNKKTAKADREIGGFCWKPLSQGRELKYKPVMNVEYKPVRLGEGYDIVNDSDMFRLYVDGKQVEDI